MKEDGNASTFVDDKNLCPEPSSCRLLVLADLSGKVFGALYSKTDSSE